MNEDIIFSCTIIILVLVCCQAAYVRAQNGPIAQDEWADVIDHTSFDSLWHESVTRGKLRTDGCLSTAYARYRGALASAMPAAFLPRSRTAFWVNAYLACLLEVMHVRFGYRSTVWDSLWLRRDTFLIASQFLTLADMAREAHVVSGTVGIVACLPTGSSKGAPLPSFAATAKGVRRMLRDQLRRICRSERYVLFDPAGNVLQLSKFFEPLIERMLREASSVPEWVLPYVTDQLAAQMALKAKTMGVVISDGTETWRKARPP